MVNATIDPVQLPTDIGSIISLISGLSGQKDWTTIANRADPWGPQRGQYQDQLNAFMQDPSSVLKDPAFLAAENLGAENISRQAGAAGMAGSGSRLADLFKFGQTQGAAFEQQKFNQLQELAGVNAGSPAAAAGIEAKGLETQGTNLATGLAGVIPMIAQLLGLAPTAAGGLVSSLQKLFGGGGGTNPITDPNAPGFIGPPDYSGVDTSIGPPDFSSVDTSIGPPDFSNLFGGGGGIDFSSIDLGQFL